MERMTVLMDRNDDKKGFFMKISGSTNRLCGCCRCIFSMAFLVLVAISCSQNTAGKSPVLNTEIEAEKNHDPSALKIVSKGTTLKELRQPRIYFRYIQYSIDGHLLGAHLLKDDYQTSINLPAGKHKLHVERLTRGMLSARAFILDDGDCYTFTLSKSQAGMFEGNANPDDEWETIGFSGVESWEKVDSIESCNE
jgi:hypothetical protein